MGKYILSLKADNNGLIKDVGGNILSNTGIYTETGKFGNKAIEVYSNTNYVQVYPSDVISTNEDFTVSVWMKSLDIISSTDKNTSFSTYRFGLASGVFSIVLNTGGSWRFVVSIVDGDSIAQGFNSIIWDDLLWHHIAITRKNGVIRLYLDGSLTSPSYEYGTAATSGNGYLLEDWFLPSTTVMALSSDLSNSQNVPHILFDDVTILKGEALWYGSSFTLPSKYLFFINYAFLSSNSVYTGTNLTKISNSWNTLSNAEKEALVPSFSNKIPSIQDLSSISPFRVLTDDTSSENVKVTGQPKPQTIEPTSLINTGVVSTLQSINITNTITDATVKFAVTTDLTTYKVYDATEGDWVTSTNIEEDGMSIAQINALTPEILALLDVSSGIAFKQCFIATSENASAELSEISAVVDIDGSWSQSVHGTDYNVAYPNKTTMSVRLLTNGDYIINYPISSSS